MISRLDNLSEDRDLLRCFMCYGRGLYICLCNLFDIDGHIQRIRVNR